MKIAKMLELAAFLKKLPRWKFDMMLIIGGSRRFDKSTLFDMKDCGSTGCIAGWVLAQRYKHPELVKFPMTHAAKMLGLTSAQQDYLFLGHWGKRRFGGDIGKGTPKQAARAIEKMIEAVDKHGFDAVPKARPLDVVGDV